MGSRLALGGLDVPAMRAATRNLKLSNVSEFTTSCNFCSCGCGMIAAVRDGQLLKMEGDYDHIVNRGSLCVKGSRCSRRTPPPSGSPRRATGRLAAILSRRTSPWDDAIQRVAQKIRKTRDETWIATEKVNAPDLIVGDNAAGDRVESAPRRGSSSRVHSPTYRQSHRRDRLHGRRAEHQRGCYLVEGRPAARAVMRRTSEPGFDIAPRSPVWGHIRSRGDDQPLGRHAELQDDPRGREQRRRKPSDGHSSGSGRPRRTGRRSSTSIRDLPGPPRRRTSTPASGRAPMWRSRTR